MALLVLKIMKQSFERKTQFDLVEGSCGMLVVWGGGFVPSRGNPFQLHPSFCPQLRQNL